MANNRGTGPATSVSPVLSANEKGGTPESRTPFLMRPILTKAATEMTGRWPRRPSASVVDPDEAGEMEIEKTFRRTIAGLRRLPRRERPSAVQAAKDARILALRALRERRAYKRHAEYLLRKLKAEPAPR